MSTMEQRIPAVTFPD